MTTRLSRLARDVRAFVATTASGKVFQINLENMTVAGSVETGKGPDGLGWVGK